MNAEPTMSPYLSILVARWWVPLVRGIAAILFGVLTFVAPAISLFALVILFGAYVLVDGGSNLVYAVRGMRTGRRWGWLLFEGVVGVFLGVLTLARPPITAMALLLVVAVWAIVTGFAEIAAALRLRRHIRGEWLLATAGVLSIALGLLLLMFPGAGALALAWSIGAYALVFGALLVALSLRLHRLRRAEPSLPRHVPSPA